MTKISRMSYKDLGFMIDSAVGAGILDRASGRAHLADDFLFKMQKLAWAYRDQRLHYDKVLAQAQSIRTERNNLSPFLARLIRNIHTSFYKFHKLGKVDRELMKHYRIPNGASRQPANRLKFWITHGKTIVRVHRQRKQEGWHLPAAYVITDAVVEILAHRVEEAEKVVQALQKQVEINTDEHIRLRQLRAEVVDTLELVKRHLELRLYKQPEPKRRLIFSTYGILYPDGKGQAHMMGLMEPVEPAKEPKSKQKVIPKPKIKEKPKEPVPNAASPPELEVPEKPEPAAIVKPEPTPEANAEKPKPLPPKNKKKIRGKKRRFRKLQRDQAKDSETSPETATIKNQ